MSARNPVAPEISLCLPADLDQLPAFLDQVRRMAQIAGLSDAQGSRLELAVEEVLVNVCAYAYADQRQPGPVYCRMAVQPDGLLVEIADEGAGRARHFSGQATGGRCCLPPRGRAERAGDPDAWLIQSGATAISTPAIALLCKLWNFPLGKGGVARGTGVV